MKCSGSKRYMYRVMPMLIMPLCFAGNPAFAATDPTVLAQQIKEAEAEAAVYMAQKAASEARKAKAEADTAAIEAENARATQTVSQQLALQTAAVALDKAKNEVIASRVNTIQDAVSLNGLSEIKRDAVTPKSNVGEFQNAAEQTATFAAQIAPRVTATARRACPSAPAIVMADTESTRGLLSAYTDAIQMSRLLVKLLKATTNAADVKGAPPRSLPGISMAVSLANSVASFAAAIRPTTAYADGAIAGPFSDSTLMTAVAGAIRMEAPSAGNLQPVSFVDLGKASIDFGAMAFASRNEQADVSIVLELGKVDTEIENAETKLAKLKVQLGTAQAEKPPVASRIADLTAGIAALEGVIQKARDFQASLVEVKVAGTSSVLAKLLPVDRTIGRRANQCVLWLGISTQGFATDIRAMQPAFSKQKTYIRSARAVTWALSDADGTRQDGGFLASSTPWAQADPDIK